MDAKLSSFALYEMVTTYNPGEPIIHWGYAIVFNPCYDKKGSLLSGYVKVDLETLQRDYSLNRYGSVSELNDEVQKCLGKTVSVGFAGRYINGWYHRDEMRQYGGVGVLEFFRFLYDLPYSVVVLQRLRNEDYVYMFRAFSGAKTIDDQSIEIRRVNRLCMGNYSKDGRDHKLQLRFYNVTPTAFEFREVIEHKLTEEQLKRALYMVPAFGGLVAGDSYTDEREAFLTAEEGNAIVDYCDHNLLFR